MTPAPLLTKKEIAIYLRVSPRTIDVWCAARLLPFRMAGPRKRFSLDDVNAYLSRHRVTPSSPAST